MPIARLPLLLVLALGFGALNAALADASAPVAGFGSDLLDAGWAWAGIAVLAGALVRGRLLGALAGWLATSLALAAFYAADALLRAHPLTSSLDRALHWWAASLLLCPGLGFLGTRVRGTGVPGLLAGLVVPVGAALEMLLLPPPGGPEASAARWVTWAGAGVAGFLVLRRSRRISRGPTTPSGRRRAGTRTPTPR